MTRTTFVPIGGIAIVCVLTAASARAQETRAERESQKRAEKAQSADVGPTLSPFDQVMIWTRNTLNEFSSARDGFYPELGGLVPGSGLAAGPGYRHRFLGGSLRVDGSAAMSSRRYSMARTSLVLPTLASNRLSVGADIKYQDFPAIDYFGVGPDTSADARTDYRLRSLDASASALVRIRDRLAVGGRVGYMRSLSVESGRSSLTPSIEDRFDETDAPGLVAQPRFQHADVFVEADSRDVPGYPTSGGFYRAGFSAFRDVTRSGHDFRRVDLDAVHYLPLFHRGSVVAVRGRLVASQTSAGQDVPFYLMPTLGSENTLRGYADYRFRDRNAALVSLEYQWPVFRVMDAALFADGGTVAAETSDLWRTPKTDYGVGIRFHSPARTFLRVDVAKSPEGTRLIVSVRAPLRTTRRDVAPYVP